MRYLGKVLTEHDLQNWVLLSCKCKCYFYSCIFINQNLHEGISHSTFCRQESRNANQSAKTEISEIWAANSFLLRKTKSYTCQMMQGIQATANCLSHSNCLDIFTSLLRVKISLTQPAMKEGYPKCIPLPLLLLLNNIQK